MERKCVPEQRQGIDVLDCCPHHRGAGLCRSLRTRRRFSVAAILAEETAVDAAEHDLLAGKRDACQAAAAMPGRLADETHARLAYFLEDEPNLVSARPHSPP